MRKRFAEAFCCKEAENFKKTVSHQRMLELVSDCGYLDKTSNYTLHNLENDFKKNITNCYGTELKPDDYIENVNKNGEGLINSAKTLGEKKSAIYRQTDEGTNPDISCRRLQGKLRYKKSRNEETGFEI
jgi:hypothetical protein